MISPSVGAENPTSYCSHSRHAPLLDDGNGALLELLGGGGSGLLLLEGAGLLDGAGLELPGIRVVC